MNPLVEQFLDYLSLERGLSPNTRAAYASDLRDFISHLEKGGDAAFNRLTRDRIGDYLLDLREAGRRTTTLARRLVAVKVFLRYLAREGLLAASVAESMDAPRLWQMLPGTLTPREVERLLLQPDVRKPLGLRDRALLETLYGAGLRVSEATGLTLDDLHLAEGYLRVFGKGRKERLVPVGEAARNWIEKYVADARPLLLGAGDDSRILFVNRRRRPLGRKWVWRLVGAYARKAGIARHVKPHTLRHSFASHLLANNAPLRIIQEMLGHADIATTQIYTHVEPARLKTIHEKFHPRG